MRITMARKIISIVVAALFVINDICFGLGVMPGSTRQGTPEAMYAAAQRLLAIRRGPGAINFDESNISRRFEGGRGLYDPEVGPDDIRYPSKYQTISVPVNYEKPPTGWKNNPILKETNLIKALEIFGDKEARIPADRLQFKEGWFPVNEDAGELPIARIERTGEGKYVLIIHTKFVKMWNHIRENDVWLELYMGEYNRRTVSAAWGIFYRLAKHEMAELSKLGDIVKSAGHISYNPESLPQDDETLANEIGGNYALVNDAIWLWFVGAYCFNDKIRYDNDEFLKRIDWFFDSPEAKELKLHLEFPNLIEDPEKKMLARAFAFTINHDFFNRPNIRGPIDLNSPVNPKFVEEYKDRESLRAALNITEAPMYAAGSKGWPAEQSAANADELSFNGQVNIINSFLEKNNISKSSLSLVNKPWPTPSLRISDEPKLTDISSLSKAPILKTLTLAGTSVEDISSIEKLVNLEILSLSFNPIKDISAVANLTNLRELYLNWTQVADISPLKGMNLARLFLEGAKNITDEQKQIYELFQNHPHPKNFEVINSLGELITYDNVQIFIDGYPAYTGDSGVGIKEAKTPVIPYESGREESALINVISEYIVDVGLDKGPGAVELPPDVKADIYKTINLLRDSQIEIFVPQSFKLTENMKKALEDIGKREGRDTIQCREYTDDRHLLQLLQGPPPSGVKRIVLENPRNKKSSFLSYHADKYPEVFRFIRLLSVRLPRDYENMKSGVKTVYQAKMMTMAILARLFENDKTPMVETLLKGMLRECLDVDDEAFEKFMDELGMSNEEIGRLTSDEVTARIIRFLGIPIRLVEKIGREIYLMKAFWIAA